MTSGLASDDRPVGQLNLRWPLVVDLDREGRAGHDGMIMQFVVLRRATPLETV